MAKTKRKAPKVKQMFLLEETMPKALAVIFPHTTD
jgi:hypothetical protein